MSTALCAGIVPVSDGSGWGWLFSGQLLLRRATWCLPVVSCTQYSPSSCSCVRVGGSRLGAAGLPSPGLHAGNELQIVGTGMAADTAELSVGLCRNTMLWKLVHHPLCLPAWLKHTAARTAASWSPRAQNAFQLLCDCFVLLVPTDCSQTRLLETQRKLLKYFHSQFYCSLHFSQEFPQNPSVQKSPPSECS